MNSLDIPKASQDLQNEVQDFSMPSKRHTVNSNIAMGKSGNKLDDTLSKLMKRKNCVSITIYSLFLLNNIQIYKE